MSKPRRKPPARKESRGRTYTISCTDEQWAAIQDGAERAGKNVSTWFVECALTVDPWPRKHRRLVLNEREQRRHARAVAASARNLGEDEAGGAGDVGADLRALMAARLRRAFGDEAAQTVAAAFIPDAPAPAPAAPTESPDSSGAEAPPEAAPQGELFPTDDD